MNNKIILTIGLVALLFSGCASKQIDNSASKQEIYERSNIAADKAFQGLDKEFDKNIK